MSYDNSPLLVERNERGFWVRAEQIDRGKSVLGMGYTLAQSGVAVNLTGTLAETTLASVTLPGGLMGANGLLRVTSLWSCTNSANNKNLRFKFAGSTLINFTATTAAQVRMSKLVWNRGSEAVQVVPSGSAGFSDGSTTAAAGALAVDTSADQVISFAAQLASVVDAITLEAYVIEVFPA